MLKNNDKSIYWAIIIVAIIVGVIQISRIANANGAATINDGIILFISIVTIPMCFGFIARLFILESIVLKSYAVKKNSAKKIVDAMLSWDKFFSNPEYKIYYVIIRFYRKNKIYNFGAGSTDNKNKIISDIVEYLNFKIDKNELKIVIREASSVINEIHKFSILIEQVKHAKQEIKLLDEIDLEKFMSWIENTFNKYNIKFLIQDNRIDSQKINGLEQQGVNKQELSDDSLENRLINLKELLDKGLINEQDYETQKREIIKNI